MRWATCQSSPAGEHGLIGLALDPGFAANGWIYLTYSRASATGVDLRVSRFTVAGERTRRELRRSPCSRSRPTVAAATRRARSRSTRGASVRLDRRQHGPVRVGRLHADRRAPGTLAPGMRRGPRATRMTCAARSFASGRMPPVATPIPAGNLFPGGTGGRPEIYAMGMRNPFRISIDAAQRRALLRGRTGPTRPRGDALRGPRGYDEFNRTSTAGNFGWPYCIAGNEPYVDYDFATGLSGQPFYCAAADQRLAQQHGASSSAALQAGPALVPVRQVAPVPEARHGRAHRARRTCLPQAERVQGQARSP